MIVKLYRLTCADCKSVVAEYPSKDAARDCGWAVIRGEKDCYCPTCALKHRNTGCKGVKKTNVNQIAINGVKDSA